MSDNVIDRLQITVEATAKDTNSVFDKLEKNLSSLQSSLSGLSNVTGKMDTLITKLDKVGTAIDNMSSKAKGASNVKVTPQLNTSGISKSEKFISSKLTEVRRQLDGVSTLANQAMGGDTSALTSFERKMTSIQGVISQVKGELDSLGNTTVPSDAFIQLENQIDQTKSKLDQLLAKKEEYESKGVDVNSSEWTTLQSEIETTKSSLDSLIAKESEMQATGADVTDPFASYRSELSSLEGRVASTINSVKTKYNEINGYKIKITAYDAVTTLQSVASSATNAAKKLASLSSSAIKSGFSSIKNSLSNIKSTISSLTSSSSKLFNNGFTKILKYGFGIRSLYVLFRRLKTAIKDSFVELQKSGAYFQTTSANVTALKSALTTLKYQFGAAFEPIFNYVAPALQTLINYLVTVMNTISAFIAKLTGQSTYSKAVASTAAIADNTGSAAGSAAEMAKQLQGFDELNNLSGESGSSGGSGGGSSSDSSDISYITASVDSALSGFWDSLADAIAEGDWEQVGAIISEKLTTAMEQIPWDDIFEAASDFGTNLASFLNGLITDDLFYQLGRTIANSIKTALIAMLSFGNKFDWEGLGTAIASGINGFVDQNPLDLAVDVFNVWAEGILDTLIAAVKKVEWKTIADHIADAISKIKASEIMEKLATFVNTVADAIYTLVSNKDTWTNLGTKIAEGINSFFTTTNWTRLGENIKETFKGIITALKTALDGVEWKTVGQAIADFIGGISWSELLWDFGSLLTDVTSAIHDVLKGAKIDAGDIIFTIEKAGILLAAISAVKLGANVTKTVITEMLKQKVLALMGSGTAAATGGEAAAAAAVSTSGIGTIATIAGELAIIVAVAVAGWKIGGKLYESATGNKGAAQGFCDTVADIWDGAFSENKVEINLWELFDFTVDDVNSGSGWLKNTELWGSLTKLRDSIKSAWNSLTGNSGGITEVGVHGYNGAPSDAVAYIEGKAMSNYWSDIGENIISGITSGMEVFLMSNPITYPIGLLFKAIKEAIEDKFKINSPAKAMYTFGESIFEGIIQGFINAMNGYSWSGLIETLYDYFYGDYDLGGSASSTASTVAQDTYDLIMGGSGSSSKVNVTYNTKLTGEAKSKQDLTDLSDSFATLAEKAGQSTSASYDAKTGGQLKDIGDVDTWRGKFKNLYNEWKGKTAVMGVNAGGEMTSIDDTYTWIEKIKNLYNNWVGKAVDYDVNSNMNEMDGQGGYLERLNKAKEQWKGGTAEFKTSLTGAATTTQGLTSLGTAFENLGKYPSGNHSGSWNTSISGKSASEISTYASAVKDLYNNFYTGSHTASYTVNLSGSTTGLDGLVSAIVSKLNDKLSKYKVTIAKALGGAFFGGSWHSIPQYAGGTLNAGSMFIAGEAGPEIVGQINGRTEVLNRSQIAATINAGVVNGLARFRNLVATTPESMGYTKYNQPSFNGSVANSGDSAMLAEQNMLLRQQNDLLMQIAEKPTGISSKEVFRAVRSESTNYYNRTGNSPFLY